MLIKGYFDDSGTHKDSPVVVWGGLLGLGGRWDTVDAEWHALLRAPLPGKPPLTQFHLTDCRNGKGEFEGYSEGERDHLTHLFRSILTRSMLFGVSMSVCTQPWDEMMVGKYREIMGDAETAAFASCIGQAREIVRHAERSDAEIALTFDAGRHTEKLARLSQRIVDLGSEKPPKIVSIAFAKVVDVPALQAADIVATESYWALRNYLADGTKDPRAHFQDFLRNSANLGKWLDRAAIESKVAEFKARGIEP